METWIQLALMAGEWTVDWFTCALCQGDQENIKEIWETGKFWSHLVWRHYPFEVSFAKYNHNWCLQDSSVSRRQVCCSHHINKQTSSSWSVILAEPVQQSTGVDQLSQNAEQEGTVLGKELLEGKKKSVQQLWRKTKLQSMWILWPRTPLSVCVSALFLQGWTSLIFSMVFLSSTHARPIPACVLLDNHPENSFISRRAGIFL